VAYFFGPPCISIDAAGARRWPPPPPVATLDTSSIWDDCASHSSLALIRIWGSFSIGKNSTEGLGRRRGRRRRRGPCALAKHRGRWYTRTHVADVSRVRPNNSGRTENIKHRSLFVFFSVFSIGAIIVRVHIWEHIFTAIVDTSRLLSAHVVCKFSKLFDYFCCCFIPFNE